MKTIVLTKVEMSGIRLTGRNIQRDGVWREEVEPAPQAKACIWLNEGSEEDILKAKEYAKSSGHDVRLFDPSAPAILETAKSEALSEYETSQHT